MRSAFRIAFIVTAAFALAAALVLLWGALAPGAGSRARSAVAAAGAVCARWRPPPTASPSPTPSARRVKIEDPCTADRDLPDTGGIGGFLQDRSLEALDRAACEFGSSREELLLALFDDERRDEFEEEYGEDPRSLTELGPALLGSLKP